MADISKYQSLDGTTYNLKDPVARSCIAFGQVDATSTATAFTATVEGVTEYFDGLTIVLKNGVATSASGFTLNVNGLGAKHSYNNLAAATEDTTLFNINYTMMFIYDSTRVSGGGWICYRGYDANTNTIGYQLRTNSSTLPAQAKFYRYRLLFTSADGTKWVPSNTSSSTNATASRTVNQTPIDPFGEIVYYSSTTAIEANVNVSATVIWQQYNLTLGYSFNRTGAALVLPYPRSIYLKCAPQADGSAIIDSTTPYVTALPSTKDGKIYIYLGRTYSATQIELTMNHPVYYCDGTSIKPWIGIDLDSKVDADKTSTYDSVDYEGEVRNTGDGVLLVARRLTAPTGDTTLAVNYDGIYLSSGDGDSVSIENVATPVRNNDAANKSYVDTAVSGIVVPTKTSDLTNDSGFLTSAVTTFNGQSGAVTYTAPVTSVNGQTGAVTVNTPLVLRGSMSVTLSPTHGTGTFTLSSGNPNDIPNYDTVYIVTSSNLSTDDIVLQKNRYSSYYYAYFTTTFRTTLGTVYVEIEGTPDDEYDWDYATWNVRYWVLQDKLTFDTTPTQGSTNPVTSGGVYDAIQGGGGSDEIYELTGTLTATLQFQDLRFGTFTLSSGDVTQVHNYKSAVMKVTVVNANDSTVVYGTVNATLTNDFNPAKSLTGNCTYGLAFVGLCQWVWLFDYLAPRVLTVTYDESTNDPSTRWGFQYFEIGAAYGNLNRAGTVTNTGIAIDSGDALLVADSSANNALIKTTTTFDGSTTTKALTQKGTFEDFPVVSVNGATGATVSTFYVTFTDNSGTYSADKTFDATLEAFNAGYAVYAISGAQVLPLVNYTSTILQFARQTSASVTQYSWLKATGAITRTQKSYLTEAVTSFNGNTGAVTYTAPVTDVQNSSGTSIVSNGVATLPTIPAAQVNSDWSASSGVAQILNKPTIPSTASDVGALPNTGSSELTGTSSVLCLHSDAATNSPILRFQRGTLTDNYNDWQIQDRGGYLYFDERGSSSSDWTNRVMFNTTGGVVATSFSGSGANLTGIVKSVNGNTGAITGIQTTGNLVTSVSSSSTDSQYPSAKLFYDTVGNIESLLASI